MENEIILPRKLTYCSHTLNLIAMTDCKKILNNSGNAMLKKIYSAFCFCKIKCFLEQFSTVASDICLQECN